MPYFILTVDTEEDRLPDKERVSVSNIMQLPRFSQLCAKHGVKLTYLCTYPVVTSPEFKEFLEQSNSQDQEIGAHLHPWVNPPENSLDNMVGKSYPSEYAQADFRNKLQHLTSAIEKVAGKKPISYRAGRFGMSLPEQVSVLLSCGYRVDCSTTPGVDWSDVLGALQGGPDFSQAPSNPYFIDENGIISQESKPATLLEVPITIGQRPWLSSLRHCLRGRSLSNLIWLRPMPRAKVRPSELEHLCQQKLSHSKDVVLVMFMHSNELDAATNPYFNNEAKQQYLWSWLEKFFTYIKSQDITPVTLAEYYSLKSQR